MGNGNGGLPESDDGMHTIIEKGGNRLDPFYMSKMLPNIAAAQIAMQFGLKGYNNTVSTACAASTQAMGDALDIIRMGRADVMVAGGGEAGICELGLAGFNIMRALSTPRRRPAAGVSRPFDKDRDGFVCAEGAGIFVFEDAGARPGARRPHPRRARRLRRQLGRLPRRRALRRRRGRRSAPSALRDRRRRHRPRTTSTTSTPTAPRRRPTTPPRRPRSRASSASTPTRCRCQQHEVDDRPRARGLRRDRVDRLRQGDRDGHRAADDQLETPDPECDLDYVPNTARNVARCAPF